jgi:parallel beta-helix repeat protein
MEMHKHVAGVVIKQCTIVDNAGYGVLGVGPRDITIADNTVTGNGLAGVVMGGKTRDVKVTGNTLVGNSARYVRRAIGALKHLGKEGSHATELRIDPSTSNVTASANKFAS